MQDSVRRRKTNFSHEAQDEPIDPKPLYKINFFFVTDQALSILNFRFEQRINYSNYFQWSKYHTQKLLRRCKDLEFVLIVGDFMSINGGNFSTICAFTQKIKGMQDPLLNYIPTICSKFCYCFKDIANDSSNCSKRQKVALK